MATTVCDIRAEGAASLGPSEPMDAGRPSAKIERFLAGNRLATPFLVVDLDMVTDRYLRLAAALPEVRLFYAVKANPAPEVLGALAPLGASFDVASMAEVDLCLAAGADSGHISFGSTIKKVRDIAWAWGKGVRTFAFDSDDELDKILAAAPGSTVCCRILTGGGGADWPRARKFGCDLDQARRLLVRAARAGLDVGASFHVGPQPRHPGQWDPALDDIALLAEALAAAGVTLSVVNVGGGFPGLDQDEVRPIEAYAEAIRRSVRRHLGTSVPTIMAEPGRYLVADAGVIQAEVVLMATKSARDTTRWCYLDVGLFGGLVEVTGEAIRHRIRTPHDGGQRGPVVIAGPACDGTDILDEHPDYRLPLALATGDRVELLSTGAYTTTCSSVGFDGFAPLRSYYV